ncbi:MAG: hypothetical protein GX879_06855, partial [Bacteroidales bacterium]|nr:hypothetical protein [Bacteroidales bacterium]
MSQKEIDIVDFYIRIASFVKRRFLLIVVISLLGVGLGGLRFYTSPPKYKVIMIASSQVIDKQYVYQLASPIKMYIEQREYENLSNYIGCDVETLSAITKFELDSTLLHSVKFSMNFSDSEKISDFRNSIIQFYKNQKFINSYYEREKTALNDFVKVIDDEIAKINAFQDKILNDDQLKSGINVYTAMSG